MSLGKLNHGHPDVLEQQRIQEIRSLTYLQRLERLFAILELSFKLQQAAKISERK
jgi:hypothetical protein